VRKGDGRRLIEIDSHHDLNEIPLDLLTLGIPHWNERDVSPEMVEAEDRGEQFPMQIPLKISLKIINLFSGSLRDEFTEGHNPLVMTDLFKEPSEG
jgi:hypothetical protein